MGGGEGGYTVVFCVAPPVILPFDFVIAVGVRGGVLVLSPAANMILTLRYCCTRRPPPFSIPNARHTLVQALHPHDMGADRGVPVVQLSVKGSLYVPLLLRLEDFLGHRLAPKRRNYLVSSPPGQHTYIDHGGSLPLTPTTTESRYGTGYPAAFMFSTAQHNCTYACPWAGGSESSGKSQATPGVSMNFCSILTPLSQFDAISVPPCPPARTLLVHALANDTTVTYRIVVWVFLFTDVAASGLVYFYLGLLRGCTPAEVERLRDPSTALATSFFPLFVSRTQSGTSSSVI